MGAVEVMNAKVFGDSRYDVIDVALDSTRDRVDERRGRFGSIQRRMAQHGRIECQHVPVCHIAWLRACKDAEQGEDEGDEREQEGNDGGVIETHCEMSLHSRVITK